MEQPLVSILIITMNHEKFIEQACQSAIAQSYRNIEIILLDNNSSDDTFKNANKAFENCKISFKLLQNTESFGVAKNLNILVSQAKGDFVCLLSGDDWLTENSVAVKVKYISEEKVDFALSDGYRYLQQEGKLIDAYSDRKKTKIIESLPRFFGENIVHNEPINVGVMVRKELLVKYPFDENIHAEDWDMNLRLTSLGYKIGFVNKKLFNYRILPSSLSSNWELMELSYRKITDKYIDYINEDKQLKKKYEINLLKYKYEKLLAQNKSETNRKLILKNWKKEKYKIKYNQPILFLKLFLLKFSKYWTYIFYFLSF